MLSHLLVVCVGSPTDDSDFAARHLIHRFHYVGVDQHVAILLADRSFIAFSVKPRLFLFTLYREYAFSTRRCVSCFAAGAASAWPCADLRRPAVVMMDGPARGRGVRYTGLLAGVGTKAVPGFSEPDGGGALSLRTAGLGALLVSIGVGMTSNLLPCGVSVSPGLVSGADADRRCWCDFGGIVALGGGAGPDRLLPGACGACLRALAAFAPAQRTRR
jgi:hypothetical protein